MTKKLNKRLALVDPLVVIVSTAEAAGLAVEISLIRFQGISFF